MNKRASVVLCMVDDYCIWDDVAERLCDEYSIVIEEKENEDEHDLIELILVAEREKLGVSELPFDDYYYDPDGEYEDDEDDDYEEEDWEEDE